jgi:hypothetical protein
MIMDNITWFTSLTSTNDFCNVGNSPFQGRDRVVFNARSKTTAVARYLEDLLSPNETDVSFWSHYKQVRQEVQLFCNLDTTIQPVSGNKVSNVIKSLKHSIAPGHDGVTNSMVKKLSCHFVNYLVVIFNSALRLQHLTDIWEKVNVVKIPKQ